MFSYVQAYPPCDLCCPSCGGLFYPAKGLPPCCCLCQRAGACARHRNPELDAAILQGRRYAEEIRRLNDEIPDEKLSSDLREIERLTREIFRQVEKDQNKLPKIRKMMNYFLPATLKLVRKYAELQGQASLGNVRSMLEEIRKTISTVAGAFRRQLDSLYEHDVVDVTADIQVMEQVLAAQGLSDETDFKMEKEHG